MKLAIVGSRNCPPVDIATHLWQVPELIISGGAKGADTYAREYAIRNGIPFIEYLPIYPIYGRKAPIIRDRLIVDSCDFLLAFWNGSSSGTRYTLEYAKRKGKPFKIVRIT